MTPPVPTRRRRRFGSGAALGLALLAAGCPAKEPARVGDTRLVQADGVVEAPSGATLEVAKDTVAALTMPGEAVVRLAIAMDVPWADVDSLVRKIEGAGKRAVTLVGQRQHTRAIVLHEPLTGPAIQVITFVDGKACVRGPGVEAAKCVTTPDHHWVEKSFVRQLVRETREVFAVDEVEVQVPASLPWSDVVNAIDGARTCCGEAAIRVDVKTSVDDGTVLVPVGD